ncbi:hypothetical protein [Roseibium aggregatum]|uniref:hypothetical protein n=1 Tax=Roseibium aggregatum TaxID=187304 RepID=UPI003A97F835
MRIVLLSFVFLTLAAPFQATAADHGKWHTDTAHGYERYWTESSTGARFTIWCPPNHAIKNTLIGIRIKGRRPDPGTTVLVELDHKLIKFRAGDDGFIYNNCPACSDNMTYFWHRLRSAVKFAVQLEDRRYSGFSLNGVRETMAGSVCSKQIAQNIQ